MQPIYNFVKSMKHDELCVLCLVSFLSKIRGVRHFFVLLNLPSSVLIIFTFCWICMTKITIFTITSTSGHVRSAICTHRVTTSRTSFPIALQVSFCCRHSFNVNFFVIIFQCTTTTITLFNSTASNPIPICATFW